MSHCCPVCYERKLGAFFVCGHGLCKLCASRWFLTRDTCPVCRHDVGPSFCDADHVVHAEGERQKMLALGERYSLTFEKNLYITSDGGVVSWFKKNVHFINNNV